MTFIGRYNSGDTDVYNDIEALGEEAFSEKYYDDVESVLTETMQRVRHNLEVIYDALQKRNYNFHENSTSSYEMPLPKPLNKVDELYLKLEKAVQPFGHLPLSLKLFYKIVGGCNFTWDYSTNSKNQWKGADPVQIDALNTVIREVGDKEWNEYMNEQKVYYDFSGLLISGDFIEKDNADGDSYAIEITDNRSIDSKFLHEEHETTFINYLRIIFENCGFGRAHVLKDNTDFIMFQSEVRPLLKMI